MSHGRFSLMFRQYLCDVLPLSLRGMDLNSLCDQLVDRQVIYWATLICVVMLKYDFLPFGKEMTVGTTLDLICCAPSERKAERNGPSHFPLVSAK